MSGRVFGKLIVVTGAGSGQGEAEARRLAQDGATVIAGDLTAPESYCHRRGASGRSAGRAGVLGESHRCVSGRG